MTNATDRHLPAQELQRRFWNEWNVSARELQPLDGPSLARADFVVSAVRRCVPSSGRLLDLGCGTGWLSEQLVAHVPDITAVDLGDEVIARARIRAPHIRFLSGDAMMVPTDAGYDAVVCVETFSHVPDQVAFVKRLADLLKPEGTLILTTQNRTVFSRSKVMSQGEGQIRRWVTPSELLGLLEPLFHKIEIATIMPAGDRGLLRILSGRKTCYAWNLLFGEGRWRAIREWAGLGQTITAVAKKK
jgi:2-polyprenyl-3-methyl-5-hydroxy-6-metoxy-1,4-benzoquinol methylase